ncbi:hypothetical protein DM872_05880 [Pseudomonas taiwanensis]|uniref:GtrA family protein n=1 Tax=Pseudomonas taiwanensis TaxID=470150 RepID=UPI0015C11A3B|nr:GtrA family protein [Pseudomonas taiwanensis]NWL76375.1 hypothetical protein [Pseudomonas taiwanensis]
MIRQKLISNSSIRQLLRYAVVGVISNCSGYMVYLLLTYLGMTPKIAMTILYCVGAGVGFFGNRKWAFEHDGHYLGAAIRYMCAHILGYTTSLLLLLIFHDHLGYPHQLVQAVSIVIVALQLFATFKFFVFPQGRKATKQRSA